jgi:LmbE family N-acetylglucosaminyl deacetylase
MGTLLLVHAHPDDESIATGGVMAKAHAEGRRVVLVTATRGEVGEIAVLDEAEKPSCARPARSWASTGWSSSATATRA